MKDMGEMLLRTSSFDEIVMGNTALVRAMVESGTRVVTSYPGSPTPEIATAIRSIPPDKRPFYFEFSVNEKVATEIAFGAAVNGHLSTVFFKSVGLNVAADTFVQLSLMKIPGGMVIILGDDPGANSSQNEQDNRHYAALSYTPLFEPADPAEAYRYYKEAAALARKLGKVIILRLTTHVCHAKEKVHFDGYSPMDCDDTPRFAPGDADYIPIVSSVSPMKQRALEQLADVEQWVEEKKMHLQDGPGGKRGIITSGLVFHSLREVLQEQEDPPDILKLAMVYPLPRQSILDFLAVHEEVLVLEELDDQLEKAIKALAYDRRMTTRLHGKSSVQDWIGEYRPDKVRNIVHAIWPDLVAAGSKPAVSGVPARPPQMCPGCGHRSAFHAIREALADDDITVADIGCHTLGYLPPYTMGEILICMGASTGVGSGLSLFNTSRKVVAFIGDSTLFHAGLPGIINALFNNHDLTLVIMENGTTAMTGHQHHPGCERNFNDVTEAIPIRRMLEGLGVSSILETDTYKQEELRRLIRQAVNEERFTVVIARHPCMLLFAREQRRKKGSNPYRVKIDQGQCDKIHTCVAQFACPSFIRHSDGSVTVNDDLCIGDGSCIQTCPKNAITR